MLMIGLGWSLTVYADAGPTGKLSGGPAGGYHYYDSDDLQGPDYVWELVTGTDDAIGTDVHSDEMSNAVNIGFDFTFFGNSYSQVYVSSEGFLTFTSGQSFGCCDGQMVPDRMKPNNLIAALWDDLDPGG